MSPLHQTLLLLPLLLFSYLCGSLPFALWVTRAVKNVDVRSVGSGHATATNTIRTAGWAAGALVLLLDISKGFLPVWIAVHTLSLPMAAPLTAALAVAGHCWPVLADFKGGMGLATSGGAVLAISPLAFAVGLGLLIFLTLVLHHGARAGVVSGLLMPFAFWLLRLSPIVIWIGAAVGAIIALRFLSDWNRQYRELWLDREQKSG